METVTVSSKGQIAIPKAIRDQFGIREGTKLLLDVKGDRILLSRDLSDWRSQRGIAAGDNMLLDHMREKRRELDRE